MTNLNVKSILGALVTTGLLIGGAWAQGYGDPGGAAASIAPAPNQSQAAPQPGLAASPVAESSEDADLMALAAAIKDTTQSLASGIAQVSTGTEVPIEAKFELEDGTLMLSVYTSAMGLGTIAEKNSFKEYKGDATQAAWNPETEVFEDFEHIARSAQYHTLLSMTPVTISDIIERAEGTGEAGPTTVLSVKPMVIDGAPVFDVVSTTNGEIIETLFDLMTGEPTA
jgi:hypothetical protein